MDENHQDIPESKLRATEDIRWVLNKRNKLLVPKHKKRTGFEDKTRWDRLQLLAQVVGAFAIPLSIIALIIGVWQFNAQQNFDNQKTAAQQQAEFQNLKDQQEQTTLETYLDRMSDLLFTQHLNTSKVEDEVRQIARARTLAALQNLDSDRKGVLLLFLYESALIREPSKGDTSYNDPIINLFSADLSRANLDIANFGGDTYQVGTGKLSTSLISVDLSDVDLHGANLDGANLTADFSGADLTDAYLRGANLSDALLDDTDLRGAHLVGANLSDATLNDADLSGALLVGANLERADLRGAHVHSDWLHGANLRGASLEGADLSDAILYYVNLHGARLVGANLSGADLSSANNLTQQQLDQVLTCKGATLPKGLTCHENR
jgi:uncharacterized protein YjbI with pentapeptide repeats